jgi:hypothetical protein
VRAVEEFDAERDLLKFVEDSRTETLAVLALFRPGSVHQAAIDAFTDAENTFRSYGHDDVTFGRTLKLKSEHALAKVFIPAPHYMDSDHMTEMTESLQRNVSSIVRFAFFTLIPPYAKWPEFPDNRGTVDEVQRANLHAKNDMPKVFVFMLKEFADEYGVRIHKTLEKVGEAISGFMVLIHVVPPTTKDLIYLQTAVYEGEEQEYMDVLAGGRLAIVGYDPVSKKRDAEARLIDSFNENTLIQFCNKYLAMLPEEAQRGRMPFPIKRADKRSKNTIGLGKYATKEAKAEL